MSLWPRTITHPLSSKHVLTCSHFYNMSLCFWKMILRDETKFQLIDHLSSRNCEAEFVLIPVVQYLSRLLKRVANHTLLYVFNQNVQNSLIPSKLHYDCEMWTLKTYRTQWWKNSFLKLSPPQDFLYHKLHPPTYPHSMATSSLKEVWRHKWNASFLSQKCKFRKKHIQDRASYLKRNGDGISYAFLLKDGHVYL